MSRRAEDNAERALAAELRALRDGHPVTVAEAYGPAYRSLLAGGVNARAALILTELAFRHLDLNNVPREREVPVPQRHHRGAVTAPDGWRPRHQPAPQASRAAEDPSSMQGGEGGGSTDPLDQGDPRTDVDPRDDSHPPSSDFDPLGGDPRDDA